MSSLGGSPFSRDFHAGPRPEHWGAVGHQAVLTAAPPTLIVGSYLCARILDITGPELEGVLVFSLCIVVIALAVMYCRCAGTGSTITELAAIDQARTALLHALGHDLRSPIAAAKASVSSLSNREVIWDEQCQQELLSIADRALDNMTALVANLLDLSRLESGVLPVLAAPTTVDEVVRRASSFSAHPERLRIDIPDRNATAIGDAALLERVIANLLENSLRYSPAGALVTVSAQESGETVRIVVADEGPGIPRDERQAVFESFRRAGNGQRLDGAGIGLGLSISRAFTEAMGGTIAFEEGPDRGLRVIVALKRAGPSTTEPIARVAANPVIDFNMDTA
jgi:two-component system sensor histidine kinase KdpD